MSEHRFTPVGKNLSSMPVWTNLPSSVMLAHDWSMANPNLKTQRIQLQIGCVVEILEPRFMTETHESSSLRAWGHRNTIIRLGQDDGRRKYLRYFAETVPKTVRQQLPLEQMPMKGAP
jgi:hypothetical protein